MDTRTKGNVQGVAVCEPLRVSWPEPPQAWQLPALYEDDHLLVVDKPAFLPVVRSPDPQQAQLPSLMQMLRRALEQGRPWTQARGLTFLMPACRLDVEDSGVLVLAKNREALRALRSQFGSEQPLREFLVLVHGRPSEEAFRVEASLTVDPHHPGYVRVDPRRGKRSRTVITVRERFRDYTLVECQALTWRRHQLRVHLAHARLCVVGDAQYGGQPLLLSQLKAGYKLKRGQTERPLLGRPAVHAHKVCFTHPVTGEALALSAPLPKDFEVAIKYLRRFGT